MLYNIKARQTLKQTVGSGSGAHLLEKQKLWLDIQLLFTGTGFIYNMEHSFDGIYLNTANLCVCMRNFSRLT